MSWTEEKVNKLKELWGKGNTASQIAEIIGGISRNAVIGKAHRLNLSAKIKTRSLVSKDSSMLDLIRPLNELFQELLFIKIFKGTKRSQNSYSLLSPSIRRNIPQYANNFSSKEIVLAIRRLAKIDKQIKTSKIDDKSAITEFVYSTTGNG